MYKRQDNERGLSYSRIISQAGVLGKRKSGLEISLGVYRWIKLEYSHGISNSLDLGIWCDFQPLLIGWSTIGIFSKFGGSYSKGRFSFRIGAGYALGVLGDNIAGHGIEGSGEDASGYLLEIEATNGNFITSKLALLTQLGFLLTDQRNPKYNVPPDKLTFIPYIGVGLEKTGVKRNYFAIIRITYVDRIKSSYGFFFPDAKIGIIWHF